MGNETLKIAIEFVKESSNPGFDWNSVAATLDPISFAVVVSVFLAGIVFLGALLIRHFKKAKVLSSSLNNQKVSVDNNKKTIFNNPKKLIVFLIAFFAWVSLFVTLIFASLAPSNSGEQTSLKAFAKDNDPSTIIAHVNDNGQVTFDKTKIRNLFDDKTQIYNLISVNRLSNDYNAKWSVSLDEKQVYNDECGKQVELNPPLEKDPGDTVLLELGSNLTAEQATSLIGTSPIEIALTRKSVPYEFYQVNFDMLGHGEQVESQKVKYGHYVEKPQEPTAAGFSFDGWFADDQFQTLWDFENNPITAATTLYAKWTENEPVDIWYTAIEGGSVSEIHESVKPFSGQAQGAWAFEDETHEFKNWTDYDDVEVGENYYFIPDRNEEGIYETNIYFANFQMPEKEYALNYDSNGATGQIESDTALSREKTHDFVAKSSEGLSWDMHLFCGWSETRDGEVKYLPGDTVTLQYENSQQTLYAVWKEACVVTFDVQGHGSAPDPIYVIKGYPIYAPEEPSEQGYTFEGWYTDPECSPANKWRFGYDVVNEDITLYAKWIPNTNTKYTVNIKTEGINASGLPSGEYELSYSYYQAGTTDTTIQVTPPEIQGFITPTPQEVYIKSDGTSFVDFKYSRNTFQLKINYLREDKLTPVADPVIMIYAYGYYYEINSPEVAGYTADTKIVEGVLFENTEIDVIYKENDNVSIYYVARENGQVDLDYEEVAPATGHPNGSTATPNPGYKFVNWTKFDIESQKEIIVSNNLKFVPSQTEGQYESEVYFANFGMNVNEFTLTYDENGGTCTKKNVITERAEDLSHTFTIKDIGSLEYPIEREGYNFIGWSTSASGQVEFLPDDEITLNITQPSKTLYAVWTKGKFKVTFDLMGKGKSFSKSVEFDTPVEKPKDPIAEGFNFEGWFTEPELETEWNFDDKVTGDMTLYAKWTPKTFTATFVGNYEESQYSQSIEQTYGEKFVLPTTSPTRTGFTFASWNLEPDGSGEEITSDTDFKLLSNTTVYAQWTNKTINITFKWNNGTQEQRVIEQTYGNKVVLPEEIPTKEGYVFKEWNTQPDGQGTKVDDQTVVLSETDYDVYAQYDEVLTLNIGTITINHTAIEPESSNDAPSDEAKTVDIVLAGEKEDGTLEYIDNTTYGPDTTERCTVVTKQVGDDWVTTITHNSSNPTFNDVPSSYKTFWVNVYDRELGYSSTPEGGAVISKTVHPDFTLQKYHSVFEMKYKVNGDYATSSKVAEVYTKVTRYIGWNNDSQYQTFQTIPQHEKSVNATQPGGMAETNVWIVDNDTSHTYPQPEDRTYYYRCEVVGFQLKDGRMIAYSEDCPYSASIAVEGGTALPVKSGGNLQAVSYDVSSFDQKGTMTVNITAKPITVEFETNGASQKVDPQIVQFGQRLEKPEVSKPGFSLIGWYTEPEFIYQWNFSKDHVEKPMKLYAKWGPGKAHYYVKHYKVKGGVVPEEPILTESKQGIIGQETKAEPEDYNGYVPEPFEQQIIKADGSTTISIYYEEQYCRILYLSNNEKAGTVSNNYEEFYCDSGNPTGSIAKANTQDGYRLVGWKNSKGEIVSTNENFIPTKDKETKIYLSEIYTAEFAKTDITYSIFYSSNNEKEETTTQTLTSHDAQTTFTIQECPFSDPGYAFVGWSTNPEGPVEFLPNNKITLYYDEPKIVLFAVWLERDYLVTFDTQGHGVAPSRQLVEKAGYVQQPEDPTEVGYEFAAWYKEPECINQWNFSTDTVSTDTTLYAKWITLDSLVLPSAGVAYRSPFLPVFKDGELPEDLVFYDANGIKIQGSYKVGSKYLYKMSDLINARYVKGTSYFKGYSYFIASYWFAFEYGSGGDECTPGLNSLRLSILNSQGVNCVIPDGCENNSWRQHTTTPTLNGVSYPVVYSTYNWTQKSEGPGIWSACITPDDNAYIFNPIDSTWNVEDSEKTHIIAATKDFNCYSITGTVEGLKGKDTELLQSATVQFVSDSQDGEVLASTTTNSNGEYYISVPKQAKGKFIVKHHNYETREEENYRTISSDLENVNFTLGRGKHTITVKTTKGIESVRKLDEAIIGQTVDVNDGDKLQVKVSYKTTQSFDKCIYKSSERYSEDVEIPLVDGVLTTPEVTENAVLEIYSMGNLQVKIDQSQYGEKAKSFWYHPSFEKNQAPQGIDFYENGEKIIRDKDEQGRDIQTMSKLRYVDGYVVTQPGAWMRCYTTIDTTWNEFASENSDSKELSPRYLQQYFNNRYLIPLNSSIETLYNSKEAGWLQDIESFTEWDNPTVNGIDYFTSTSSDGFYNIYYQGLSTHADKCWSSYTKNRTNKGIYDTESGNKWQLVTPQTEGSVVVSRVFGDDNVIEISGCVVDNQGKVMEGAKVDYSTSYNYKNKNILTSTNANKEGFYSIVTTKVSDDFSSDANNRYLDYFQTECQTIWAEEDDAFVPTSSIFRGITTLTNNCKKIEFNLKDTNPQNQRIKIVDFSTNIKYEDVVWWPADKYFDFRIEFYDETTKQYVYGLTIDEVRNISTETAEVQHITETPEYDYYRTRADHYKTVEVTKMGNLKRKVSDEISDWTGPNGEKWQNEIWYHPYWAGVNTEILQNVKFFIDGEQILFTEKSTGTVEDVIKADGIYVTEDSEQFYKNNLRCYGTMQSGAIIEKGSQAELYPPGADCFKLLEPFSTYSGEYFLPRPISKGINDDYMSNVLEGDNNYAQLEELINFTEGKWLGTDLSKTQYLPFEPKVNGQLLTNGDNGFYDLYYNKGIDPNIDAHAKYIISADILRKLGSPEVPHSFVSANPNEKQWLVTKCEQIISPPTDYSTILSKVFCNDNYRQISGTIYSSDEIFGNNPIWVDETKKWEGHSEDFIPNKTIKGAIVSCSFEDEFGNKKYVSTTTNEDGTFNITVPKYAVAIRVSSDNKETTEFYTSNVSHDEVNYNIYLNEIKCKPLCASTGTQQINYYPVFQDNCPPNNYVFYKCENDGTLTELKDVHSMKDIANQLVDLNNKTLFYKFLGGEPIKFYQTIDCSFDRSGESGFSAYVPVSPVSAGATPTQLTDEMNKILTDTGSSLNQMTNHDWWDYKPKTNGMISQPQIEGVAYGDFIKAYSQEITEEKTIGLLSSQAAKCWSRVYAIASTMPWAYYLNINKDINKQWMNGKVTNTYSVTIEKIFE